MIIRKAGPEDFDDVFAMYMDEAANPFLTFDLMDKHDFKIIYTELLDSDTLYVAELEGEVAGTFRVIHKQYREADTSYIAGVALKTRYQGKGFGKKLLEYIIEDEKKLGKKRLELTVALNNTQAISLYKKQGFQVEGIKRLNYKLNGGNEYFDEYSMALIL